MSSTPPSPLPSPFLSQSSQAILEGEGRKSGSRPSRIDVDRLHVDTALAQKYTVDVQNRVSILRDLSIDDVESSWKKLFCHIICRKVSHRHQAPHQAAMDVCRNHRCSETEMSGQKLRTGGIAPSTARDLQRESEV